MELGGRRDGRGEREREREREGVAIMQTPRFVDGVKMSGANFLFRASGNVNAMHL